MSNPNFDLINTLNVITFWLNQIVPPIQIFLGTFGNLFNIIIFTRRTLRTNPCSMYFLASSINNLYVVYVLIGARYLAVNWNLDVTQTNNFLCKLRTFAQYPPFSLVLWFPVLASIDRYLSSSRNARLRRLSSLSIARKIIVGVTIVFFLIHVHMAVFYETDWAGYRLVCAVFSYQYFLFFNIFGPLVACILPIIFMSIFGVLMIFNVRSIHNRVAPQADNTRNERLHSSDRQLIKMLLFQVLVTLLLSAPYVALSMYYSFFLVMFNYQLSLTEQMIYIFTDNLAQFLYYSNTIIGFYIYTLTGPKFRVEMKLCIQLGLAFFLTATGLMQCLPLRTQQAIRNENPTGTTSLPATRSKRANNIQPIQHGIGHINT